MSILIVIIMIIEYNLQPIQWETLWNIFNYSPHLIIVILIIVILINWINLIAMLMSTWKHFKLKGTDLYIINVCQTCLMLWMDRLFNNYTRIYFFKSLIFHSSTHSCTHITQVVTDSWFTTDNGFVLVRTDQEEVHSRKTWLEKILKWLVSMVCYIYIYIYLFTLIMYAHVHLPSISAVR